MSVSGVAAKLTRGCDRIGFILGGTLAVYGCASLPGSGVAEGVGHSVEISRLDGPGPTVVFEAGLAGSKEAWNKVFPEIGKSNSVFAYNRPGVGRSAETDQPRDGATIVEQLRVLLKAQHIPPPYVLVGHSAGGLYMQWYARCYPQEVAGLVLVDPTHPTQFAGEGELAKRGRLATTAMAVAGNFGSTKAEFAGLDATGQQVLAAPPLSPHIPTRILTAPDKSGTVIAAFDNGKRADFAYLYPTAIMGNVDCGHNIPQEKPEAVVTAIRDVLAAVRVPKPDFSR